MTEIEEEGGLFGPLGYPCKYFDIGHGNIAMVNHSMSVGGVKVTHLDRVFFNH